MKYFAGLDVSLQETAICIVDEDGIVIIEGKAASEPDDLVRWLAATGLTIERVGLEAGPLSPWLHAGLRGAGLPAICIETRRMKGATAAMAVKTDRNDARAIAHAMRVGWFTTVHVKTAESQELRLLLSNRRTLLEKRVAIDNEIRGTLKAFGLKLGKVTVAAFEARVLELLADRSRLLAMVKPMLAARAALRQQCEVLHRMVLKMVRANAICRRLLSVPGVGPIVALTYATGVDDPTRFAHARDLGPHFGLTPRKYASGEIDRNGSITKAWRRSGTRSPRSGCADLAHACSALVRTQSLGHGHRQATRAASRNRRRGAQAGDRHAPDLGRRHNIYLVTRDGCSVASCRDRISSALRNDVPWGRGSDDCA
jgi:transposase